MVKRMWPNSQAKRYRVSYFTTEDFGNGTKIMKWYKYIVAQGIIIHAWRDIEKREYSLSHRPPLPITEDDIDFSSHRTRDEENRHKAAQIAYYWPIEQSYYVESKRRI